MSEDKDLAVGSKGLAKADSLSQRNSETRLDLEEGWFKEGVLGFDQSRVAKEEEIFQDFKNWADEAGMAKKLKEERTVAYLEIGRSYLFWQSHFGPEIPKSWSHWDTISKNLEQAQGVKLTTPLINAALFHPHVLVLDELGRSQRLSSEQIAVAILRYDNAQWRTNEFTNAQKGMGVSDEEIAHAREIAKQMEEKIKDKKDGYLALISPSDD